MLRFLVLTLVCLISLVANAKAESTSDNVVRQRIGITTVVQRNSDSMTAKKAPVAKKQSITQRRFRVKGYRSTANFVHYALGFKSNKLARRPSVAR